MLSEKVLVRTQTSRCENPASCLTLPAIDAGERLLRIERLLQQLVEKATIKQHYSVDEFSEMVKRASFTVRQWCNESRINAEKSLTQSGSSTRWVISHQEYERYSREGLLPLRREIESPPRRSAKSPARS